MDFHSVDLATFSQFVIKANISLFWSHTGSRILTNDSWSFLLRPNLLSDEIVYSDWKMTTKEGKTIHIYIYTHTPQERKFTHPLDINARLCIKYKQPILICQSCYPGLKLVISLLACRRHVLSWIWGQVKRREVVVFRLTLMYLLLLLGPSLLCTQCHMQGSILISIHTINPVPSTYTYNRKHFAFYICGLL